MDLTPYYGEVEDVRHFHATCRDASPIRRRCPRPLQALVRRVFLPQTPQRTLRVGGVFFDDLNEGGFERCFDLTRAVGDAFTRAYLPFWPAAGMSPTARERDFRPIAGDATWNSTWSGIAGPCSAFSLGDARNRS